VSAAQVVSGYPGGPAVLAAAQKVEQADSGAITAAAERLSKAGTSMGTNGTGVSDAVKTLDDAWQGASADQFVSYMSRFSAAGTAAGESLTKAGGALSKVATAIDEAKHFVSTRCEQVISEVKRYVQRNPDVTDDQYKAAITPITTAAATDIENKLKETEEALKAAVTELQAAANPSARYTDIPDPGTQPFIPAPGKAVVWDPTPQQSPQQTTAQSAQASNAAAATPGAGHSSGGSGGGGHSGGSGGGGGGMGSSGAPPAGPVPGNVQDWIKQAQEILRANGINVPDADVPKIWAIIQHESGGNPHAINNWDCVPLDTMIMTNHGWLKHDEVRIGDRTIGYNPSTGHSEWTTITRVVHHVDAPLVRIGNSRWHATTTPNHRWLNLPRITLRRDDLPEVCPECGWVSRSVEQAKTGVAVHRRKAHGIIPPKAKSTYAAEAEFVQTKDLRSRDRIVLAAPADTGGQLDITVREAAILGWIAGDGYVETRRHRPTMSIAQSKPEMVEKLRRLLDDVPHAVYIDDRGGCGPRHQFRLDHAYASDLVKRAGHPRADAVNQVLAMSTGQRDAWLEALTDAEGTRYSRPGYTKPQVVIYQAPGNVLEAATMAIYLSGARPRVLHVNRSAQHAGWSPEAMVRGNTAVVTNAFLRHEDAGRGDVWCVTTGLGTWTAREDDHIFLTGNSNAAKGTPSKGLMQCIDPTFNSYKLPGHGDIWNPVDNICAGVNYAISRYGSLDNVPGIKAMSGGGAYRGY
jgi:uncharacterized protein YukE